MTEGRFFHTGHALEFGREPEQGGSEHERVYQKDHSERRIDCSTTVARNLRAGALWITAPRTV